MEGSQGNESQVIDEVEHGGPPIEWNKGKCIICLEEDEECFNAGCRHSVCQGCWQIWLASEFDKKRKSFLDLKCPADKCDKFLDDLAPKLMSPETLKNYGVVWKNYPRKSDMLQRLQLYIR